MYAVLSLIFPRLQNLPCSTAPPTDEELQKRGLGFHLGGRPLQSPPPLIADEIRSRLAAPQLGDLGAAAVKVPREVQLAVAMARAQARGAHPSYDGDEKGKGVMRPPSLTRLSHSSSNEDEGSGPLAEVGSPYSLGKALPKGVSWRYVDFLAESTPSPAALSIRG